MNHTGYICLVSKCGKLLPEPPGTVYTSVIRALVVGNGFVVISIRKYDRQRKIHDLLHFI